MEAAKCHCDFEANEITVVKAGENQGRKFLTCSQATWDKATNTNFGGCKFFHWSDTPITYCVCGKIKGVTKTGYTFCEFCASSALVPILDHIKSSVMLSHKLTLPGYMCECYADDKIGVKAVHGRSMVELFCKKDHKQRSIIAYTNVINTKKLNTRIAPRLVLHVDKDGISETE